MSRRYPLSDTSAEANRVQQEILRRLTATQRLALVGQLCELVRSMAMAGLRLRHPDASNEELTEMFFEVRLGPELARQVLAERRLRRQGQ